MPPCQQECMKMAKKTGGFTHFLIMRVAQEMLGAPTVGGGSAWPGSGGGGSQRSQITFQATLNVKIRRQNCRFPTLIELKIAKNNVFS
jgi:hypothetical protein